MESTLNNSNIDPAAEAIMDALAGPVNFWEDAPIIFAYTRAMALADGVLIDVTSAAQKIGFRLPVAITDTLMRTLEGRQARGGGDFAQSLLTTMSTLMILIHAGGKSTDRIHYRLPALPDEKAGQGLEVWAHIGPGDTAAPVLTIMLEGED